MFVYPQIFAAVNSYNALPPGVAYLQIAYAQTTDFPTHCANVTNNISP